MGCEMINGKDVGVFLCGPQTDKCSYCDRRGTQLCDFDMGDGSTCDRRACVTHAKRVGRNRDYCKEHSEGK